MVLHGRDTRLTDTPTTGLRIRDMEAGTNLSVWGDYTDVNFNIVDRKLTTLENFIVSSTTQTVSYTDYSSSNPMMVANVKLTGPSGDGTFTSGSTITMPSIRGSWDIFNMTGGTVTFQTATGTAVAIPASRRMRIASDGTDFYDRTPSYSSGYVSTLVNNGDVVVKYTLEAAIAAASGLTAPFILVSASDTTAGYLGTKVAGSGVTISTQNSGGNESLLFTVTPAVTETLGLTAGSAQTAGFTAAINTKYVCNFTASATITLPASATAGDIIALSIGGGNTVTLGANGLKVNASTSNFVLGSDYQTIFITYTGATNGWV